MSSSLRRFEILLPLRFNDGTPVPNELVGQTTLLALLERIAMPQQVSVELELPEEWQQFRLPPALDDRLQELLDRQDREGKLAPRERKEAKALTELVDILALLKARTALSGKQPPA